jgi:Cu/Ag efflux protein CusF
MKNTELFENQPSGAAKCLRLTFVAIVIAVLVAIILIAACNRGIPASTPGSSKTGPAAAVQTASYHSIGLVKSLDPKRPSIEIDHEDIKDLMPAMTMEFYVKDKSMLDGLKRGDRIEFTIENGVGGVKITEIKKR